MLGSMLLALATAAAPPSRWEGTCQVMLAEAHEIIGEYEGKPNLSPYAEDRLAEAHSSFDVCSKQSIDDSRSQERQCARSTSFSLSYTGDDGKTHRHRMTCPEDAHRYYHVHSTVTVPGDITRQVDTEVEVTPQP